MTQFYSTREAAKFLGVKPDTLQKALWLGRIEAPEKSPSGSFLWTAPDINRASWVLCRRAYLPSLGGGDDAK